MLKNFLETFLRVKESIWYSSIKYQNSSVEQSCCSSLMVAEFASESTQPHRALADRNMASRWLTDLAVLQTLLLVLTGLP